MGRMQQIGREKGAGHRKEGKRRGRAWEEERDREGRRKEGKRRGGGRKVG